jgi:hypothetical protein
MRCVPASVPFRFRSGTRAEPAPKVGGEGRFVFRIVHTGIVSEENLFIKIK